MIPFAGHDPNEISLTARHVPAKGGAFAYELFQLGWDTMRIANRLGISEAKALKLVNEERSAMLHLDSPYKSGDVS